MQTIADIAGDGAPRKQGVTLEDVTNVGRRLPRDDRNPVNQDLTAARPDQGRDHVEHRALAGARRPEQGHELAAPSAKRNVAYGFDGSACELKRLVQPPPIPPTLFRGSHKRPRL